MFLSLLMMYTAYDAESACRCLEKSINSICKWSQPNGFKFSIGKTVAIHFTGCKCQEVVPNLKLNRALLPYAEELKSFGKIFNFKLIWAKHIDNLKLKVKKFLNLLKMIAVFSWDADKKILRIHDALYSIS